MAQNNPWLWVEFKKILVQPNKQEDYNYDINILVPKTMHLWLNNSLDSLVIVMLWLRNMKLVDYKSRSIYFTVVKYLSR